MSLLLGTFAFSLAASVFPLLNLEAYMAVVATQVGDASQARLWALAVMAGAGQALGKVPWFYAGRESMRLPWLQRKMAKPKWKASYDRWHARIHGRPVMAGLIMFASAWLGFPPLAVLSVLAGAMRMNIPVFLTTMFVGRTIRFWMVLAGVDQLAELLPGWL